MKPSIVRLGVLISILSASAIAVKAQVVVVLRTSGVSWQALPAEKIVIDDKNKLRTGSSQTLELQPAEYKKLPAELILRAGTLRRHAGGYLVRKESGSWVPVAPDGVNLKTAASYASLWSSASIGIQEERNAKGTTPLKMIDLFAILPGSDRNQAVVDFLADASNFRGVGEKNEDAAFEERMSMLVGLAGSVTGAPSDKLKQLLLTEMETANQRLSAGTARYSDLEHGLQYEGISAKAYPDDERQKAARTALLEKKAWLIQRMAILKAFAAGELWDALLDKYGEFDRYDNSFEDIRKLRDKALVESTNQHRSEGQRLYEAKKFSLALGELKLAQLRSPGNKEIADLIEEVKTENDRIIAGETGSKPVDPKSPQQTRITTLLAAAKSYIGAKKWEEAERELRQAEALDKKSYRILFVRAKLLEAQGKLPEALKMLDKYAQLVTADDDVTAGADLRGTVNAELSSQSESLKGSIEKAEADGDYPQARDSAQAGAALDPTNLYFLLHAGRDNAILRDRDTAKRQFEEYLKLSQTSGSDAKQRAEVYNYIAALKVTIPEPQGKPNWYSGYKSPAGLFYCPVSLMPNAHAAEVKASRKQTVSYQWNGDQLAAVHTRTQEQGSSDVNIFFDYFKDRNSVRRVAKEPFTDKEEPALPRFTPSGPVGAGKGAYTALLNHPVIDPLMVERLTGKRVATVVAGNQYFHPFVWDGIYRFLVEYDDQGRVKSATRLEDSGPGPRILDFRWDGLRLVEIAERGAEGYRRTMTYAGDQLTGEIISFRGRNSKIEYKYRGDQLAEANCGDDASIDGRSRHVTFR
jgi:hypothetical protein